MIVDKTLKLYKGLRLYNYKSLFSRIREREGSLSATEAFSVDAIYILGNPTIKQFSDFLGISQPNASYKVNSLMAKGYIEKIPSEEDRREHRLCVADRFYKYYEENLEAVAAAVDTIERKYSAEELALFESMLDEFTALLA